MKALVLEQYGSPGTLRLRDWPEPEPRAGELCIEVHCAGLNPVDFKIRDKKAWPIVRLDLPAVMGNECAGVVKKVGPGVTRFSGGDRVMVRVAKSSLGALSEQVCVPEALAAKVPAAMSMAEAAALPLVGLTAYQVLFEVGGLKAGEKVFIQVGAGGVGTMAIQLAKKAGAHVVTTASGKGVELCRRLGADEVIDYKTARWQDAVKDVDFVFDALGPEAVHDAFAVVKRGGRIVSIAGPVTVDTARQTGVPIVFHPVFWNLGRKTVAAAAARGLRYDYWFMRPDGGQLVELAARFEKKELEVVIDKTYPFAQALEALAYVEGGRAKGKVVVQMK
jgi:NADPH:quinone reductase-like Zn-dependent oxidoreductase